MGTVKRSALSAASLTLLWSQDGDVTVETLYRLLYHSMAIAMSLDLEIPPKLAEATSHRAYSSILVMS